MTPKVSLTYRGHEWTMTPHGYYRDSIKIAERFVPNYVMYKFALQSSGEADL